MNSILLISAPGAGKGVTAKYLKEKYKLVHMSIGDLIRSESNNDKDIRENISKGNFIDNNIVYNLFTKFLNNHKNSSFVFEGFPRLMEQINFFENILNKNNIILDKIIFINIKKDIALKRIKGRLICNSCNEIYNKYIESSEKCSKCGDNLSIRTDDKIHTYEIRYELFKEKTMPVVEYYRNRNDFYEISNNGSLEELKLKIDNIMGK